MTFTSNNNKALLWSVLQNNNVFQGFKNDDFSYVHQEFEKQISNCYNESNNKEFNKLTLMDQNKRFINIFRDFLSSYKKSKINNSDNKLSMFNNSSKTIINDDSKQQNIFEQRLREKQKEFDELIKNPKPDSINFSDNNELTNQLNNQVNVQINNQLNNGNNKTSIDTKDVKQENDTINLQSTLIKERNYENISENNTSNNINLNANTNNQTNVPIELFNKILQQMKIIENKLEKQENTIISLKEQIEELQTTNINNEIKNEENKNVKENVLDTPSEETYISHKT